jgi:hypothetical protein
LRIDSEEPSLALTPEFAAAKQDQWAAFLRRTEIALAPEPFPEILAQVAALVMPPVQAFAQGVTFIAGWPVGGPWTNAFQANNR